MAKQTTEYREYIDAAAGFSWSESGHTELKRERDACTATPDYDADATLKSLPRKASDGAVPRRSTT